MSRLLLLLVVVVLLLLLLSLQVCFSKIPLSQLKLNELHLLCGVVEVDDFEGTSGERGDEVREHGGERGGGEVTDGLGEEGKGRMSKVCGVCVCVCVHVQSKKTWFVGVFTLKGLR